MQNNTKLLKRRDKENTKDKGKFNIIVDLEKRETERQRERVRMRVVFWWGESEI